MKTMADYAALENAAARRAWKGNPVPVRSIEQADSATAARYRTCAKRGLTQTETAEYLGVTRTAVAKAKARWDIDFVSGHSKR